MKRVASILMAVLAVVALSTGWRGLTGPLVRTARAADAAALSIEGGMCALLAVEEVSAAFGGEGWFVADGEDQPDSCYYINHEIDQDAEAFSVTFRIADEQQALEFKTTSSAHTRTPSSSRSAASRRSGRAAPCTSSGSPGLAHDERDLRPGRLLWSAHGPRHARRLATGVEPRRVAERQCRREQRPVRPPVRAGGVRSAGRRAHHRSRGRSGVMRLCG